MVLLLAIGALVLYCLIVACVIEYSSRLSSKIKESLAGSSDVGGFVKSFKDSFQSIGGGIYLIAILIFFIPFYLVGMFFIYIPRIANGFVEAWHESPGSKLFIIIINFIFCALTADLFIEAFTSAASLSRYLDISMHLTIQIILFFSIPMVVYSIHSFGVSMKEVESRSKKDNDIH